MAFCTACGAQNDDASKFCIYCGAKMEQSAPEPEPAPYDPPNLSEQPPQHIYEPAQPAQQPYQQPSQPVQQTYQQPSQPAQGYQQQSYGQPGFSQYVAPIPTGGLMAWSIITLLLCLIPGIVALVKTTGINKSATVEEQQKKYSSARTWCIIGTVLGVLSVIGSIIGNQ